MCELKHQASVILWFYNNNIKFYNTIVNFITIQFEFVCLSVVEKRLYVVVFVNGVWSVGIM